MNDQQWFDRLCETLYTAVISDTLDELGYRNQVMSEKINRSIPIGGGRQGEDDFVGRRSLSSRRSYAKEIEAVDSVKPGEVVIGCTNDRSRTDCGESCSRRHRRCAARARDRGRLDPGHEEDSGARLSCIRTGTKPVDSQGRGLVIDYDIPVNAAACSFVRATSSSAIATASSSFLASWRRGVLAGLDKATRENHTRDELLEGRSFAKCTTNTGFCKEGLRERREAGRGGRGQGSQDRRSQAEKRGVLSREGFVGFIHRSFTKSMGYTEEDIRKPVIGICNTFSELNKCHSHFNELVDYVKRASGRRAACRWSSRPSLLASLRQATTMLLANFDGDGHEEMMKAHRLTASC
ncbi:hypothetical protein [Cohnella faecalis]|nr:hypothetical protein [Cohnella faecalis]